VPQEWLKSQKKTLNAHAFSKLAHDRAKCFEMQTSERRSYCVFMW
jgi:hypothetical protein